MVPFRIARSDICILGVPRHHSKRLIKTFRPITYQVPGCSSIFEKEEEPRLQTELLLGHGIPLSSQLRPLFLETENAVCMDEAGYSDH